MLNLAITINKPSTRNKNIKFMLPKFNHSLMNSIQNFCMNI